MASAPVPFDTLPEFFHAFEWMLRTESYGARYPVYEDMLKEGSNVAIVLHLLTVKRQDPQEGLVGLMRAVVGGARYACEFRDEIEGIVRQLLDAGAELTPADVAVLFAPGCDLDLEDDAQTHTARAMLINLFRDVRPFNFSEYVPQWEGLVPTYWEYLSDDDLQEIDRDTLRLMNLRYCVEADESYKK